MFFGTYELELFPIVRRIVHGNYDLIVNIGAGEGYYAVGLLSLMPGARSVAFETREKRRTRIDHLARRNGVSERLIVRGTATAESLQSVLHEARRPVVLCDIEGGEKALLDPGVVQGLRDTDILVEVHDFVDSSISQTLRTRFGESHEIEAISSRDRTLEDPAPLPFGDDESMLWLVSERRPCQMNWLWLLARRD